MEREFTWKNNGFLVKLSGEIRAQDILETDETWKRSPNIQTMEYQIWDMIDCDFSNFYESDTETIATQDSFTSQFILPNMKLAMVATNERTLSICEAYKRRAEEKNSSWCVKIFPSVEEAERWCYEEKDKRKRSHG